MRSPPMCMLCRLHLDTKGWDWVPSEKLSLFTFAWSVWSRSLVTSPGFVTGWLWKGGRRAVSWRGSSIPLSKALGGEGKGGWAAQGRRHFSPLPANSTLTAHVSQESRVLFGQGHHSGGYFLPDALCHHEVKWSESRSVMSDSLRPHGL